MGLNLGTRRFWMGFLIVLLVVAGCKKQADHSDMFDQIFKHESTGTFRGIDLGMDLKEVLAHEGVTPKHDDQWGYVYEYGLGGKNRYFLEYVCRDPKQRKVNSIVLNVLLEEKAAASKLSSEIEDQLRHQYGVADGNLGNLVWRHEESNLLVSLRMLDDKKSISLSYGSLQPL